MDSGAHFYRCDFQVHTPRDTQWVGAEAITDAERLAYAVSLIGACRERQLNAIAITDHHDLTFVSFVRRAAREEVRPDGTPVPSAEQIVVFPAMELTLAVPCQALLIFDATFPEDLFPLVLNALAITPADPAASRTHATVTRLAHIDSFLKLQADLDKHQFLKNRYIVLPNVSEGGTSTLLRAGMAPKYIEMPCVGGYIDGAITQFGRGNARIISGGDQNWGAKKLAVFQTSDNRRADHRDLARHTSWVKWATPTAEALRQACLAQESRIVHEPPLIPSNRIAHLSVSNCKFLGPVDVEINPQFNAFIGSRGTGKSTLLEYLRWILCDQPPQSSEEDDIPNYQARRKSLIANTLAPFDATLEVRFFVNNTPHLLRRKSQSGDLLLKIADRQFEPVTEADVRSLLPIQAYSQKQLSNVGIRVDELKRFIENPVQVRLGSLQSQLRDLAGRIRHVYSLLERKRSLDQVLRNDTLSLSSLRQQIAALQESLSGLSPEDQNVINSSAAYSLLSETLTGLENDLSSLDHLLRDLTLRLATLPRVPQTRGLALPSSDEVETLREQLSIPFSTLRGAVAQAVSEATALRNNDSAYAKARTEILVSISNYQILYEDAKKRSTTHQTRLQELQDLERRTSELAIMISETKSTLDSLGSPEIDYEALWLSWWQIHDDKAALLQQQCEALTELSQGEIRARLDDAHGVSRMIGVLRSHLSGASIRSAKYETMLERLSAAEDSRAVWKDALSELETLANLDKRGLTETNVPLTPSLTALGLSSGDIARIAGKLTTTEWLGIALTPLEDVPTFEFRAREAEYIPFSDASAGQQATALLKVLLNQPGPPLVIDQPEDDLDNQVIQQVIESIWASKASRQLIFASHNANLVVNGDAELVVCFDYRTAADHSGGRIRCQGAIDIDETREAIKTVMEGGELAFKLRRDKYGF